MLSMVELVSTEWISDHKGKSVCKKRENLNLQRRQFIEVVVMSDGMEESIASRLF